jgi:hypothetical protein
MNGFKKNTRSLPFISYYCNGNFEVITENNHQMYDLLAKNQTLIS